jgi:hypothetical protein
MDAGWPLSSQKHGFPISPALCSLLRYDFPQRREPYAGPVKPKKHGPFYQLSYSHLGKSTTRFVRPNYAGQIKKELATYKRFRELTQEWVTQELALSQLRLDLARRKDDEK